MLQSEWNDLLEMSLSNSPMLTWEWLFTWWQHYRKISSEQELYLLIVRSDENELVGALPFFITRTRRYGIPVRQLAFLGTGESESVRTCAEFLDIIVRKGWEQQVISAIANYLATDKRWDKIVCCDVMCHPKVFIGMLGERLASDNKMYVEKTNQCKCPLIRLPASWDSYLSRLTPKRAKRIKYERRRLKRIANLKFVTIDTETDIKSFYPRFVDLHQELWAEKGKLGCFGNRVFSKFLTQLTDRLALTGGLRIFGLKVNGELLTAYYLFHHGGNLYYYNSGRKPLQYRNYSLGNITLGYIIQKAISKGVSEFHFFKGPDGSFKEHWTNETVTVSTLHIYRKRFRCRLIGSTERLREKAKTIIENYPTTRPR